MKEKFDYPVYDEITEDLNDITALYIRYSELEIAKESNDVVVQYKALKQYCLNNSVDNPFIFIDDNYMGSEAKSPAYQTMLKQLISGKIRKVIFYSVDRIGSAPTTIIDFLFDCQKYNFNFYVIADGFDSTNRKELDSILSVITNFQKLPKFGY